MTGGWGISEFDTGQGTNGGQAHPGSTIKDNITPPMRDKLATIPPI